MLRGNKKNGENPSAVQNRSTEIKVQERTMRHMKKINFTRQKWNLLTAKRIRGNNRTAGKNLAQQMNSRNGEKYYAATIILPRAKQENWNAALRVLKTMKNGYHSKLNSKNQNNAAKLQTMEIPEIAARIRNGGNRMKDAADIENIGGNA